MSFFQNLGNQPQQQPGQMTPEMQNDLYNIKNNTWSFLKQKGYNIPDGMTDAKQITRYLLQTGQVSINPPKQIMRGFGR